MADDTLTSPDAAREFWKHLRDSTPVMLGINDPDQHAQPMTAFAEPEEEQVWVSKKGFIRLAFEVAKANITHTPPKAGGVTDVSFH